MITPYILGQILGISFLIIGLAMLFNKRGTVAVVEKMTENSAMLWLSGFIALLFGSTLLAFSNFNGTVPSLIAILGIISFLKGVGLLWFPKAALLRKVQNKKMMVIISAVITLIIAIILISKSF